MIGKTALLGSFMDIMAGLFKNSDSLFLKPYPEDVLDLQPAYMQIVADKSYNDEQLYIPEKNKSTMPAETVNSAAILLAGAISVMFPKTPCVLEIFAGNLVGSQILQKKTNAKWIASDIVNTPAVPNIKFYNKDALSAVQQLGAEADILIAVAAPPFNDSSDLQFCDLFAINAFIEESLKTVSVKLIVLVGEIGASDFSTGLDTWLANQKDIVCIYKYVVYYAEMFDVSKKIVIFQVKNNCEEPVTQLYSCDECKIFSRSMKMCSKCKNCYYCSRECQVANWPTHKKNCQIK
jgi:hypothetical protein